MIQQHELIATVSILEYNTGTEKNPDWSPTTIDAVDLGWLAKKPEEFNRAHRPIPLTEKILVEWCGFEKETDCADGIGDFSWFSCNGLNINKDIGGWFIIEPHGVLPIRRFHTLHHLQLLVLALTQQPLKITLP